MLIADAQVHIWAANTPDRPWPARQQPHRPEPFSKDNLLSEMNAAGVGRAIIVPASWAGDRNDLGLEAARKHPDRFAVMGLLDIEAPASRGQIATWLLQPGMFGLRLAFRRGKNRQLLAEGSADWLWSEAEKHNLPIMVIIDADQITHIDRIAERHPRLKLILDHLCLFMGRKDEEAFSGLDKLLLLKRRPNIAVKASCLPTYTSDSYPFHRLHPFIRQVYDAFGPQRIFWGTDLTRLTCSYRQAVTMFTEEIPWLTADDKQWIMGRGLCEWLGWKMP